MPRAALAYCAVARPARPSTSSSRRSAASSELGRLLASLERQTHGAFRVLLVDQNEDDRLEPLLAEHADARRRAPALAARPLTRAQRRARARSQADLVAFPDDDCEYPHDLLERVGRAALRRGLDRTASRAGQPTRRALGAVVARERRRAHARRTSGTAGSRTRSSCAASSSSASAASTSGSASAPGTPWSSGEEIDS